MSNGQDATKNGFTVEPIRRSALIDQVVSQIEAIITEGKVKDCERLPSETDLARQFAVGRGTIRESLIILAARGFVTRSRRGTFVARRDPLDVVENKCRQVVRFMHMENLLEARYLLETEIASLSAARCTDDDLESMTACLKDMREAAQANDIQRLVAADTEFHLAISQGAQNEVLSTMVGVTRDLLSEAIHELFSDNPALRARAVDHHHAILEAIKKENPSMARQAMNAHLADISNAMATLKGRP